LLAFGLASAISCRSNDVVACTREAVPGINISSVTDSLSGADISSGVRAVFRDGSYADTARVDRAPLSGAYERAGTYSVTVDRSGYQMWSRQSVVVTRGICHVNTAQLAAKLQPLP
jgi:hypothetical protein